VKLHASGTVEEVVVADIRLEWLSTIAERHPGWLPVLEQFGIHGREGVEVTLAAAADRAGADVEAVLAALAGPSRPRLECASFRTGSVPAMVDHLLSIHHEGLWRNLPAVTAMLDTARQDGGGPDVELLGEAFARLRADMEPHLLTEERVLFPACRDVAAAFSWPSFHIGSLLPPIDVLRHEHDHAMEVVDELDEVVDRIEADDDAPVDLAAVRAVTGDLRRHLAEETDVLFPKVLQLAEELAAS
jgi:regulator of cell morphogenesis and NO signaling